MICSTFKKKNFGFTLIELLIVIAIIAVLTTFGAASYTRIQKGSRDTQRKADLAQVRGALEQFYSDFNRYPSSTSGKINDVSCSPQNPDWGTGSFSCTSGGTLKTYLRQLPNNPRGNAYFYDVDSTGQIYCLGVILETVATGTLICGTSTGLNYRLTQTD